MRSNEGIPGGVKTMSIADLLESLRNRGIEVQVKGDRLALNAPAGAITPALQEELRRRKSELMAHILATENMEEERVALLTFAQQRLWLVHQFAPKTAAYNIPQFLRIESAIDATHFAAALDRLAQRHSALRTRIVLRRGEPVQVILRQVRIPLRVTDLSSVFDGQEEAQQSDDRLKAALAEEGALPFDLGVAPLIRFHLFCLAPSRFIIAFQIHHIIADQWSLNVLQRDLIALYREVAEGIPAQLPMLTMQYADIAERERSTTVARLHAEQLEYWRTRLQGMPAMLELPFSKPRPSEQTYTGATLHLSVSAELTHALRQLAARSQTTLYLLMFAAFVALLYRYTGQEDLCIGTPVTGRSKREEEEILGLFVNMLPVRCAVHAAQPFDDFLHQMAGFALSDFEHHDIPFQKLVSELHPHRSSGHTPLFQLMFALNPKSIEDNEQEETFIGVSKFDLTLQIAEHAQTLVAYFEYRTDLYERTDIEQFGRHFVALLTSIVQAPRSTVGSLALLTVEDQSAFAAWNNTRLEFDRTATLIDLFEAQASATPNAVALCHEGATHTYRQLYDSVNTCAAVIRQRGGVRGQIVALCMDRSPALIVSILAVLQAGAAYLPLDPKYPPERLAYMLRDSSACLLLTQKNAIGAQLLEHDPHRAVAYVEDMLHVENAASLTVNEVLSAGPNDAAYLIYTSGSSGQPKGVVVEHCNAVALIAWAQRFFEPASLSGILASTSVCFDLSIFEIFLPLATGNTIILVYDVLELVRCPDAHRVTLVNTVPSAMNALLQGGLPPNVHTVCMAGEFLPTELVDRVYAAGAERVFDLYGPSETTTYSTCALREAGASATIGRPIANTRIYLLDESGQQVPPGALGEIYIGGEGVTRGYLNKPELTAERYVMLPAIEPGGRLYRTGDLARQSPDGALVFMGRRDQQIKLRGYRIELTEIEIALREASGVAMAAVVVLPQEAGDVLAAFLLENDANPIQVRELQQALQKRLPAHMIPSFILPIQEFPLTPNGKIDRKALSHRKVHHVNAQRDSDDTYDPPQDLLEQWLANIWAHRLGLQRVARNAHFFEELGGHSLAAFELFAEIEARLGVAMMLATLVQAPTIAELAHAIRREAWTAPLWIRMAHPADTKASTAHVLYVIARSVTQAQKETLATDERVMLVKLHGPGLTAQSVEALAQEIAQEIFLFEATEPALLIQCARAEAGLASLLKRNLSAKGLRAVTTRIL